MKIDLASLSKQRPEMAAVLRAVGVVDAYGRATVTIAQWKEAATAHPDTRRPFDGSKHWAELHRRPLTYAGGGDDTAWLKQFAQRLPCGDCRKHWREIVTAIPPDFATRDLYFTWTVRVHNAVNQRLSKPVMELSTATLQWRPQGDGA